MRLVDTISLRSRERKLQLFLDELHPAPRPPCWTSARTSVGFGEGDGCGTLNFFEEHYPWPERITALGLHDGAGFRARYPEIPYVQGDACALPFADGEFDIVFSNAVIEHVGGRERQRKLVSEAIRVGRRAFITTPNRRFPVEVHTRLPVVHWLPDASRRIRLSEDAERVRYRGRPPDAAELRRPVSRPRPHRQSRHDAGGDRRLARAASPGSRSRSSSSGSSCTTPRWRSCGTSACAERRSTWSPPGRRRSSSLRSLVVAWHVRHFPAVKAADVLAIDLRRVIVVYWAIPQDVLGGEATARGELLALRHHLFPGRRVCARRLAAFAWEERGRVGGLSRCRPSSWRWSASPTSRSSRCRRGATPAYPVVPRAARARLRGLSGLPENWVFNTGDEDNPIRRLVSTFLSPLASAYALVVALIYVVSRPFRWWWGLLAFLLYVALLFTHTRAALAALAFGLVVLALAQRRIAPAVLAAVSVAAGALFLSVYPSIGPSTSYTRRSSSGSARTRSSGDTSGDPFAGDESSTGSHWRNLRDGARVVIDHPQGYGLGNAVSLRSGPGSRSAPGVDVRGARCRCRSGRCPRVLFGALPCSRVCGGGRRGWPPHSPPCS